MSGSESPAKTSSAEHERSLRPRKRASKEKKEDVKGSEAAIGSCHCCGGMLQRIPESARRCGTCGARYHAYDCGNRRSQAGFTNFDQCPRCAEMCMCTGGPMICHTRSLRDSRREKRQNTGGSSSGLSTMEGSRISSRTDAEEGAGPTRTTSEEVPVHTRTTSEEVWVQMDNLESARNSGDVAFAFHDDSVGAGGGSYKQNDGLPGALRFEIDSLRMENELLRQRLTTLGRLATMGGSTGPSSPVPVPEPRRIEDMTSSKDVDDTDGAAEVFFPEEAPGDDRGPLTCFNATHSMYVGDAWSMEIIQVYRERVAAQGGAPGGPVMEAADPGKIFWRNVWFSVRMVVLVFFLIWFIAWTVLKHHDVRQAVLRTLFVFFAIWAYQGFRNLLAYCRLVLAESRRRHARLKDMVPASPV